MAYSVLTFVALGLILLGGLSGAVLFIRAAIGRTNNDSTSTLWGLFILGLVSGIAILFLGF